MDAFWVVLLLLAAFLVWLWKIVNPPPSLALAIDKTSLGFGEQVVATATLMQGTTPLSGKQVPMVFTPPTGDGFVASPTPVTAADGKATYTFTVPANGPAGAWKATASSAGTTPQEKTFTRAQLGTRPVEGINWM